MYPNHRELIHPQESPDDLDASIIFLQVPFKEFVKFIRKKAKTHKQRTGQDLELELIFLLDDPNFGKTVEEKVSKLRKLKAIREDQKLKTIIRKITVKGKKDGQMIEANVFSSDITYEVIE
ncbi:MAG: hypothetical protein NUV84_02765 [Candidatus Uhrbacteria bacterium]|nr:hypothetical protein [Candidatus Uhrbacteria bacterium]